MTHLENRTHSEQIGMSGFVPFSLPRISSLERPRSIEMGLELVDQEMPTEVKEVPLEQINVIVQARDEYEGIKELAEAIKKARVLLHTPFAGKFDREGAGRYLHFVYGIYGDKADERKTVDDLSSIQDADGSNKYLIAISGHRRLKALGLLGKESVSVKITSSIDPLEALFIQAQENTPKLLKDYERAEQHGRLYAIAQYKNLDIPITEFSKHVGQKPEVVRRDLRFYSLPPEVKEYVVPRQKTTTKDGETFIPDQPLMSYLVACQLGRLVDKGAPKHEILFLARRFFEENVTSEKEAQKRVSRYLEEFHSGEMEMQDIFGMKMQRLSRHKRKQETAERFAKPLDDATSYFMRVLEARKRGLADEGEDNLSIAAASTRLKTFGDVAEQLIPLLKGTLKEEEKERLLATFKELSETAMNVGNEYSLKREENP